MAIIHADDRNFNEVIKKDIVLVDFYANWCGPCKMLAPILEEVDNDNITIVKVDVDESPEVSKRFGIMSIPTLVVFKNGIETTKKIGLCSKTEIEEMINK